MSFPNSIVDGFNQSHLFPAGSAELASIFQIRGSKRMHYFVQTPEGQILVPLYTQKETPAIMTPVCRFWLEDNLGVSPGGNACSCNHYRFGSLCKFMKDTTDSCFRFNKNTCTFVHLDYRATVSVEAALAAVRMKQTAIQYIRRPQMTIKTQVVPNAPMATVHLPPKSSVVSKMPANLPMPPMVPQPVPVVIQVSNMPANLPMPPMVPQPVPVVIQVSNMPANLPMPPMVPQPVKVAIPQAQPVFLPLPPFPGDMQKISQPVEVAPPQPVKVAFPQPLQAALPPFPIVVLDVQNVQKFEFFSFKSGYVDIKFTLGNDSDIKEMTVCVEWLKNKLKRLDDSTRVKELPCDRTHSHPSAKYSPCVFNFAGNCKGCKWAHYIANEVKETPKVVIAPISDDFNVSGPVPIVQKTETSWNTVATNYKHQTQERKSGPTRQLKTMMCSNHLDGNCTYSAESCRFAHHRSMLEISPAMKYRFDFITALSNNTLPADYFHTVFAELIRVMSEPSNLRCLKSMAAKLFCEHHSDIDYLSEYIISLRYMWWNKWNMSLLHSLEKNLVAPHDFMALLTQWRFACHIMRSDSMAEVRNNVLIIESNTFALFGEPDNSQERNVLALYELSTRRCMQFYNTTFRDTISTNLATMEIPEKTRKFFNEFISSPPATTCPHHDSACLNGGHAFTFINMLTMCGSSKRQYEEKMAHYEKNMSKLLTEYEALVRQAIKLHIIIKTNPTTAFDAPVISRSQLQEHREQLLVLMSTPETAIKNKVRSIPLLVKYLTSAEIAFVNAKNAGLCPVSRGYTPLCVDIDIESKPSSLPYVIHASATADAARSKKQATEARKLAIHAAEQAELANAQYHLSSYITETGEEEECLIEAPQPAPIPRFRLPDYIPTKRFFRTLHILSEDDDSSYMNQDNIIIIPGKNEVSRAVKNERIVDALEQCLTLSNNTSTHAEVQLSNADRINDMEKRREEQESKRKSSSKSMRDAKFESKCALAEEARINKLLKHSNKSRYARDEAEDGECFAEAVQQVEEDTIALTEARAKLDEIERIAAIEEAAALNDMANSTTTIQSKPVVSRFFNNDDDDSDDDNESDNESADTDDDIEDEIALAKRAVLIAEQNLKQSQIIVAEMKLTKYKISDKEMKSVNGIALDIYNSGFVPLTSDTDTRFVVRMVTTDNDGTLLSSGSIKPILFGPFRTRDIATALKKEFKGLNVIVDTLERVLQLKPEHLIQPDSKEFGYYLKISITKASYYRNLELIEKAIIALISNGLCTFDSIKTNLSVFFPTN